MSWKVALPVNWVPTRLCTDLRGKTGMWLPESGQTSYSAYFLSSAECMFSSNILTLEQPEPTGSHCSSEPPSSHRPPSPQAAAWVFFPPQFCEFIVYNHISFLIIPKLHFFSRDVFCSTDWTAFTRNIVTGGVRYRIHQGAQANHFRRRLYLSCLLLL